MRGPLERPGVVVVTDLAPGWDVTTAASRVEALGATVTIASWQTDDDLIAQARDCDALVVGIRRISRRVIASLDRCRVIVRCGVGVDVVDVAAATEHGIPVCNVPDYCTDEVASHTLALLLACARHILPLHQAVAAGRWPAAGASHLRRLRGSVLGLVGLGRISRAVLEQSSGLGLIPLVTTHHPDPALVDRYGVEYVDLATLLARADFISLHVPLRPDTHHLIGEAELRRMKPTAFLINTARGALVDQAALTRALQEGWIAGAALDVLDGEPPRPDDPLLRLPNVILTPHIAASSQEAVQALAAAAMDEVVRALTGQPPRSPVNFPTATRLPAR